MAPCDLSVVGGQPVDLHLGPQSHEQEQSAPIWQPPIMRKKKKKAHSLTDRDAILGDHSPLPGCKERTVFALLWSLGDFSFKKQTNKKRLLSKKKFQLLL